MPTPVATQTNVWDYGHLLAGIVGLNPARGVEVLSLVSVMRCQVQVFMMG